MMIPVRVDVLQGRTAFVLAHLALQFRASAGRLPGFLPGTLWAIPSEIPFCGCLSERNHCAWGTHGYRTGSL